MKMNIVLLEKKKEKMEDKLILNLRNVVLKALVTNTGAILIMALGLRLLFYKKWLAGILCIIVWGCFEWLYARFLRDGITQIRNEVTRFWNVFKLMTENEEFDLVGEEKKSTHIPRVE